MIKSALEYLIGLGKNEIIEVEGFKYSTKNINKILEPRCKELNISTLTGLVDYIKTNIDNVSTKFLIVVNDYKSVSVLNPLNKDMARNTYIDTEAIIPEIKTSRFLDIEEFNIMLQSCFLDSDDKASVLKLIGNIKEENVKTTGDDGIAQSVTAKAGIARVEDVVVPNPVKLVPFKTFVEIDQPEIKYVFRMKSGPSAALFEADGGAWKLETMLRIKKYLQEELKDFTNVEIIA